MVNVGLAIVIAMDLILLALLQIRAGFVLDPCREGARWLLGAVLAGAGPVGGIVSKRFARKVLN